MVTSQEIDRALEKAEKIGTKVFELLREWEDGKLGLFITGYNTWYTIVHPIVKSLAPERVGEFEGYFQPKTNRKSITNHNYVMADFFNLRLPAGSSDLPVGSASNIFFNQTAIVRAIAKRSGDALRDIKGQVSADLGDAELEEARQLAKVNLRAAGAVAGVVLEGHLRIVVENHQISLGKKKPMLNNLNLALKSGGVLDQPTSRKIEHLGDIRNYCCHKKEREPTEAEVDELISGVSAIIKTVF